MDADYPSSLQMALRLSANTRADREPVAPMDPKVDGSSETPDVGRLSRAIVAGDSAAFERFFELYSGRLYRFVLILARGDETTAREVTQNIMIKLARKFRILETDADLWAWLTQVARNAFIDFVREKMRWSRRALVEPSWLKLIDALPENPMLLWLEEALQSLPRDERELLEAVYFEHHSQRDCAAAAGTTQKAIESKLARIRARLRQLVLSRMKNENRTS